MKFPSLRPPGRWYLPPGLAGFATTNHHYYRLSHQEYNVVGQLDAASEDFIRAIEALTGSPHVSGNQLKLLINGDQIFPPMLQAIRTAKRTINFLTYVYWRGEIGKVFADALCERARAGVRCNVLIDALGAEKIGKKLIKDMTEAGVHVERFRPVGWVNITRLDNRTHRKILVVDGKLGFTGGVGIADEWTGNAQDKKHWRDSHLQVEGPAVRGLQGAFLENWLEATNEILTGEAYLPHLPELDNDSKVQITRSSAGKGATEMETLFYLALSVAEKRIWLTTAYFAPRETFVDLMCFAAERGVDVRLMVPGIHSNKIIARETGRKDYTRMLNYGVRIFEYQPTMLHAKTITIDSVWASIGSSNFDNRSFLLNDEANLSTQDRDFVTQLDTQFEQDLERCKEITLDNWKSRSFSERIAESVSQITRREV